MGIALGPGHTQVAALPGSAQTSAAKCECSSHVKETRSSAHPFFGLSYNVALTTLIMVVQTVCYEGFNGGTQYRSKCS